MLFPLIKKFLAHLTRFFLIFGNVEQGPNNLRIYRHNPPLSCTTSLSTWGMRLNVMEVESYRSPKALCSAPPPPHSAIHKEFWNELYEVLAQARHIDSHRCTSSWEVPLSSALVHSNSHAGFVCSHHQDTYTSAGAPKRRLYSHYTSLCTERNLKRNHDLQPSVGIQGQSSLLLLCCDQSVSSSSTLP